MKFRYAVTFISAIYFASFGLLAQTEDSSLAEESSQPETVTENPSERLFQSDPALAVPINPEKTLSVYVIPVRDAIGQPTLFAIRSGIKDAIEKNASLVILEMDTPGGELGATLDIMKTIDRFEGGTATFINEEAISAGAIIASVTPGHLLYPKSDDGELGSSDWFGSGRGRLDEAKN